LAALGLRARQPRHADRAGLLDLAESGIAALVAQQKAALA